MAAKKTDASVLVKGLGMGMAFLQALTEEIVAAGGFEEMIHFLTKESARPICKKIAELVVTSEWKIPRSLMERFALEKTTREWGNGHIEEDVHFNWKLATGDQNLSILEEIFDVPVISFSNDDRSDHPEIPQSILDQIVGKPAQYPMIVEWEEEPHIVVLGWGFKRGEVVPEPDNNTFSIAPAKYFNLDQ